MNRLLLLLFLMISVSGMAQTSSSQSMSSIIAGTWENDDCITEIKYTFKPDGSGNMHIAEQERYLPLVGDYFEPAKDYAFKWTIKNNLLTIAFEKNIREPEMYLITGIVNQNEFKCRYADEYEDDEEYIITFTRIRETAANASANEPSPLSKEYIFPSFMTGKYGHVNIEPLIENILGAIPLNTKLSLDDCQKILLTSNISLHDKEFIMKHTDFERNTIWIQHLYTPHEIAPWFFNLQIYGYSISIGTSNDGLDVDYSFYLSKNKKKSKEVWDNVKYHFDLKSCRFTHEKIELSTGDTYRGIYENYKWELFYCKTWMGYYTIRLTMTPCKA